MGNNNSKQNKETDKKNIPSEYNNLEEKKKKSYEYFKKYHESEDINIKIENIKKAIYLNNNDKNIIKEYLNIIRNESIFFEELKKYQVIFTPEEIKENNFPINKLKTEKNKLMDCFEEIFNVNTKKDNIKEFINKLSNEYDNIFHFKLPITYENKELYYYKNYCLLLEMFKFSDTTYNKIKKIELLQNNKDKIIKLFKFLDISEKLTEFIFLVIFSFNDSNNFKENYYRIIDNFLNKKDIQKEIDFQKKNLILNDFNLKYNIDNDTFVIYKELKQYYKLENFSLYSPYLVLNNLYFYENKFILKEKYKIAALTFDNFFECEFYKKYKKKIYINYKKIINSNVLKECIKKINSECPEYFIHKLTKYFEISDVIEKNIDIYPFDTQIGITDKYTMKIYLKGIISINKLDSYNIDYNNLLENLYNDSYFNLIFIHEFCGHFIRVYIYYMLNNEYLFYTPRLNINKKYIQESGKQLEFLLFDRS